MRERLEMSELARSVFQCVGAHRFGRASAVVDDVMGRRRSAKSGVAPNRPQPVIRLANGLPMTVNCRRLHWLQTSRRSPACV